MIVTPSVVCIDHPTGYHACVHPPEIASYIKKTAASLGFDRCGIARAEPIGRADYLRQWLVTGRAGSMDYLHRNVDLRIDPSGILEGAKSVIVVALLYNQPAPPGDRSASDARSTNDHSSSFCSEPRTSVRAAFQSASVHTDSSGASVGENQPSTTHIESAQSSHERTDPARNIPPSNLQPSTARGKVASYAWGDDYHKVVKKKLFALADAMRRDLPMSFETRACVDTAPIVERELAAAAGIGWIGKNTLVLNEGLGSYFFLGALVTTLELPIDEPSTDHCGTCTACLDACPTSVFPAPYEMDASRCISYLTIEHRGDISKPFQKMMGDWLFGCDVCQEVCPYNKDAPVTQEDRFKIRPSGPDRPIDEIVQWSEDDYRASVRGSAMKRAKFDMLKRNARIVLANVQENTQAAARERQDASDESGGPWL